MTLSGTERRRVRGHLQDVAPAAFVQMIAIEKETCALVVREAGREGVLFFVDGDLWDAQLGDQTGEEAAVRILGWDLADVETRLFAEPPQRSINAPLTFILLESMRRRDEGAREGGAEEPAVPPGPTLAALIGELDGVDGACLIDLASGRPVEEHFAGTPPFDPGEVVRACHELARVDVALAARAMRSPLLEEIVLTFGDRVILLRVLPPGLLLAIIAHPARVTLPAIHAAVRRLAPVRAQEPSSWRG